MKKALKYYIYSGVCMILAQMSMDNGRLFFAVMFSAFALALFALGKSIEAKGGGK